MTSCRLPPASLQNEVQDLVSTIGDVGNSEAYTRMLCLSQRAAAAAGGSASGQGSAGEGADDSALASAILKAYEAKLHNTQARRGMEGDESACRAALPSHALSG